MGFQLIRNRLSSCVTIGLGGFDTHRAYEYQSHVDRWDTVFGGNPARFNGLTGLTLLISLLKDTRAADGRSLVEHTTVVISSEFSRLDRQASHNPANNTYLLMGKGFKTQPGGRIFGASAEETAIALPVDLSNGLPDPARGALLTPGHMFDTILAAGGLPAPRAVPALLA